MGNLFLYVAREPPSTSLATVLALKDRSFTCGSFASRTRSLATPLTHELESDSFTADFFEDLSFFTLLLLPTGSVTFEPLLPYPFTFFPKCVTDTNPYVVHSSTN